MPIRKKDFYTIQEFADYLSIHYNTVYNGIKKGHIQAFKVGRGRGSHYRICASEISRMGLFSLREVIDGIIKEKEEGKDPIKEME